MLQIVMTAALSYIGTTTDYVVILLFIFGQYRQPTQVRSIVVGAYLGNAMLVMISVVIALGLKQVPEEWLLGLLGILPIIIGIKNYDSDSDEVAEVADNLRHSDNQQLILKMVGLTIATCGADNIALYVPYFATIKVPYIPLIFVIFMVILSLALWFAYQVTQMPIIYRLLEHFGDKVQLIIYVALGIYVMFAAGTLQHLLTLL
jgi:cadmium resistance transport/sequestration family protein